MKEALLISLGANVAFLSVILLFRNKISNVTNEIKSRGRGNIIDLKATNKDTVPVSKKRFLFRFRKK